MHYRVSEYLLLSAAETIEGKVHQQSLGVGWRWGGMYPLTVQGDVRFNQFNSAPVHVHLQIYPDPELEQQILALPIRCIHSEEGCRWTGQMKQLQVSSLYQAVGNGSGSS